MLKGDDSGGGSPLWMSPEALLEEPVITVKVCFLSVGSRCRLVLFYSVSVFFLLLFIIIRSFPFFYFIFSVSSILCSQLDGRVFIRVGVLGNDDAEGPVSRVQRPGPVHD
jgi:hypothetical protein